MMDARVAPLAVETVGQGRPLVLLHGWALHGGLFAPIVPSLARTHRVHAIDLPGHGYSEPLSRFSLDAAVAALEASVGEVGALDVLGWSLGATIALAWAHMHPRRVRRLVLVGATPRFAAGRDWPHGMAPSTLRRFADEFDVDYRATLLRFLTLQVQGSEAGRSTLAALRQALFARGTPNVALLREALEALAGTDLRGALPAIAQPVLIVAGEHDTLVPLDASAWLAAHLPDARCVVLPGAAHAPFLSHSAAFLAVVQGFLES